MSTLKNSYEESVVLRHPENPRTSESYRENKEIGTFVSIPSWPAYANFYKFHSKEGETYKVQCRLCFLPKKISETTWETI